MILLRFGNGQQEQIPEGGKDGSPLANIPPITARGLFLLHVQLQQQDLLLSFKLLSVILETAQPKKEWKPALSKGLQPGFLADRPHRHSVPEGTGNGGFVIISNGVQTGYITRMKITPLPEIYGFISRHTSVWLKQDLHLNVNVGFQCAPRGRKILKLLTSRTWGKVLWVAPVTSGGEGAQQAKGRKDQ